MLVSFPAFHYNKNYIHLTSAVATYEVGVYIQLSMILATLATDVQNLPTMFLVLRKFDVKGDNLQLEYHN